jgi:hypothetical protein
MRKVRKTKYFGGVMRTKRRANEFGVTQFEIAKLELHDGDMVVLRTDMILNQDQVQALRDRASQQFPGIKVAILSAGLSLAVLSDKRTVKQEDKRAA